MKGEVGVGVESRLRCMDYEMFFFSVGCECIMFVWFRIIVLYCTCFVLFFCFCITSLFLYFYKCFYKCFCLDAPLLA